MPITEMQEQVTKAILPAFEHIADPDYRETIAGCWARAAMQAMYEPTAGMANAISDDEDNIGNYKRMVRAALTPTD